MLNRLTGGGRYLWKPLAAPSRFLPCLRRWCSPSTLSGSLEVVPLTKQTEECCSRTKTWSTNRYAMLYSWQNCAQKQKPLWLLLVCVVLCCVMRPKAGLIVGKQTCGSFNLLYTTIRPIIGLASREYKHWMLATADTTAVAASCTDLVFS